MTTLGSPLLPPAQDAGDALEDIRANDDPDVRSFSIFAPAFGSEDRRGTIVTAVFNLLSSMVGGGTLSLPYAFYKAGLVTGTLLLVGMALVADFSIYALLSCSRKTGANSIEDVTRLSLGARAQAFVTVIVAVNCFLGVVGYCILMRGIAGPLVTNYLAPDLSQNRIMQLFAALAVPLLFLRSFAALKHVGMVSMASIATLGACIALRSVQCNGRPAADVADYVVLFGRGKDVLDSVPLFICPYICHFNVLSVHRELVRPRRTKMHAMVHGTVGSATLFYGFVGVFGYLFGNCSGAVQGNILLNFHPDDKLLVFARCCLTLTIVFAFPMLVVPSRDSFVRIYRMLTQCGRTEAYARLDDDAADDGQPTDSLRVDGNGGDCGEGTKVLLNLIIFASGVALAGTVSSVTVVWNICGSSFSIVMGFLFPCASYLLLESPAAREVGAVDRNRDRKIFWCRRAAYGILVVFLPLMVVCTINAVHTMVHDG